MKIKDFCKVILGKDKLVGIYAGILCLAMSSCLKQDKPITQLPPKTGSTIIQVQMGPSHDSTYYISLEKAMVVGKSLHYSWDIKFDASETGSHVLLNSGKSTRVFASDELNINGITSLPSNITWGYDSPCQTPDSTCIGDWYDGNKLSKGLVYIIRLADKQGNFTYHKMQFVSVSETKYTIRYAPLESTTFNTMDIPKNPDYNFTYFSFSNNGMVLPIEPPKTTWDIQVTRYSHAYYQLNPVVNYQVNGVLHNNYNTLSAGDTLVEKDYNTFTATDANAMNFSPFPNSIGFTWKNFSTSQSDYIVYDKFVYAVRTQNNQLFKLHFIGYKTPSGESYAPKFKFERLL